VDVIEFNLRPEPIRHELFLFLSQRELHLESAP
jgi:hypothetical protein